MWNPFNKKEIHEGHKLIDKHKKKLLQKANVIGVGYGYKIKDGVVTDEKCIQVYVKDKVVSSSLSAKDKVPEKMGDDKTDVIVKQMPKAFGNFKKMRPAQPGYSIGHFLITAGTFGCVVYKDVKIWNYGGVKRIMEGPLLESFAELLPHFGQKVDVEKTPLMLSNNHVLANSLKAGEKSRVGEIILQPGVYDGGDPHTDMIAKLYGYVELKDRGNHVDCAIAQPFDVMQITDSIPKIGVPLRTAQVKIGDKIQKNGRTTGYTTGQVTGFGNIYVDYEEKGQLLFENQIFATAMSQGGDSGSLVLDMQGNAIGLLFAGSDTDTIINPIGNVLEELNVHF